MKNFLVFLMFVSFVTFAGCATIGGASEGSYKIADDPRDLPKGAKVKVLRSMDDSVVIGIKGAEVLRVEIYGRGVQEAQATTEKEWIIFSLPKGRWFNFIFMDRSDNMYHYVYVTKEDADMPPDWMDKSITVFQPSGWGAAMTAREFKK